MTGSIRQIQMVYNPEEDRVLFRVNTTNNQQFRFWFTRRYCILLLKVLSEHFQKDPDVSLQETPEARQAVQEFKREQALNNANFKEQFQEEAAEFPLGDNIPVAHKLSFNFKDSVLQLGIQPKEGQGITLGVNQDINTSITQLLLAAAKKGQWMLDGLTATVSKVEENRVIN